MRIRTSPSARIRTPYLMFLGDAADQLAVKTAAGVAHWRPEWCAGQFRLPGANADLGLADMTIAEAAAAGCQTLVIGVANRGGVIADSWVAPICEAMDAGMDIASGLHNKLADTPRIAETAARTGRSLMDVRHPSQEFPVASGAARRGKRVLTVGTDCNLGKMFATLALWKDMTARGVKCDFRATGQTGIFISGAGVSVDAVVSDFVSGAVEQLAPENDDDHWDLIEGQGSLFHPSFSGVSLGLLHGAQPQYLVMCHQPGRAHMRGAPHMPPPDIAACIRLHEDCARILVPQARVIGLSFNTSALDAAEAERVMKDHADKFSMPCVDPVRGGAAPLVDALLGA
ncbi:MAG: N-acetyltransferase DgcN [Rhodospirillales bacterium]